MYIDHLQSLLIARVVMRYLIWTGIAALTELVRGHRRRDGMRARGIRVVGGEALYMR